MTMPIAVRMTQALLKHNARREQNSKDQRRAISAFIQEHPEGVGRTAIKTRFNLTEATFSKLIANTRNKRYDWTTHLYYPAKET